MKNDSNEMASITGCELFPQLSTFDLALLLQQTNHSTLVTLAKLLNLAKVTPCQVIKISVIAQGLSQQCFEISTGENIVIAKTFNQTTSLMKEVAVLQQLQATNLAPQLLSYTKQAMLMSKLSGKALNELNNELDVERSSLNIIDDHIKLLTTVMAKFHLACQPLSDNLSLFSSVSLKNTLTELCHYAQLTDLQAKYMMAFLQPMLKRVEQSASTRCLCHGDLNVTNVFIDQKKTYLLDFESACIMPIEYDLAMMLAVNELPINYSKYAVKHYQSAAISLINSEHDEQFMLANGDKAAEYMVTPELVQPYYFIALAINGLWYLGKHQTSGMAILLSKANKQFYLAGITL